MLFNASGAGNLSTTLGQNFSIGGMTMASGSSPVSIAGNALTLGSSGITLASGAGNLNITSSVTLGAAQAWTNNSSSLLTCGRQRHQ